MSTVVEDFEPAVATDTDLAAWAGLHTTGMTELMGNAPTAEDWAERLRSGRAGQNWCWAARTAVGEPISGVAELRRQPYDPQVGLLRLYVAESARRHGLGGALRAAALERARGLGLERLRSHTMASSAMEAFVRSDGRARTVRRFDMQEQRLDRATLDHCWDLAARPARGFRVTYWEHSAPETMVVSFGRVAVHQLDTISGSRPLVEQAWGPERVRAWERAVREDGSHLVVCAAVERTSDEVVAATATLVGDAAVARQYTTAVMPEHRRRGLATRIKANQALRVHDLFPRVRSVLVAVDQRNEAMIELNRSLRYERVGERLLVEEELP